MAQDDDFQEVKRRKRHISEGISETAKKSNKSVPTSDTDKLSPKAVLICNLFAPLRTTDMDTTTEAENTLLQQEAPRKPGRPPPIMMTSTTNIIRLQSDLKEHIKGEYEFKNSQYGTRIIIKEMAEYSAIKSYLEKNNLHYFTFPPNSKKPIKAIIRHLPPDMPAEDISNSLEDLGSNIINVRQMMAI
jgi:hypothetical protein